jgi:hypothetical protein
MHQYQAPRKLLTSSVVKNQGRLHLPQLFSPRRKNESSEIDKKNNNNATKKAKKNKLIIDNH